MFVVILPFKSLTPWPLKRRGILSALGPSAGLGPGAHPRSPAGLLSMLGRSAQAGIHASVTCMVRLLGGAFAMPCSLTQHAPTALGVS